MSAELSQPYDITKCVQVLKYIISNHTDPDVYNVLKILYLADKEHLLKHGSLITPDYYVKMKHGPVPDLCYNIIKFVRGDDYSYALLDESIKKEIRVLANHKLESLTAPDSDYLAETNIECLDEALNKYGKLEFNELSDLTHNDGIYNSKSIKLNEEITILDMAKVLDESGLLTEYLEDLYPDKIRQ